MARTKKSKAVPVVAVLTLLIIAAAVVCFLIEPLVIEPQREAIRKANEAAKAEVENRNKEAEAGHPGPHRHPAGEPVRRDHEPGRADDRRHAADQRVALPPGGL